MEISRLLKEREEEERAMTSKSIKAREVPAHTYLPMYEEFRERQEQRSRFNKENSYAMTRAMQKPFSFAERDERRRAEKVYLCFIRIQCPYTHSHLEAATYSSKVLRHFLTAIGISDISWIVHKS